MPKYAPEAPELRFSEAMMELEEILGEIREEQVDIDELSPKVERAAKLIKLCSQKIERAEIKVKEIVASLDVTGVEELVAKSGPGALGPDDIPF